MEGREYAELSLVEQYRADMSIQRTIPLTPYLQRKNTITFGRVQHDNVDIAINSKKFSSMVSRNHATIACNNHARTWTITDNKSTNGVLVNFSKIDPQQPKAMTDGDIVTFGTEDSDLVYTFEVGRRKGNQGAPKEIVRAQKQMEAIDNVAKQGFYNEKQKQQLMQQVDMRPKYLMNFDNTPHTTSQIRAFSENDFRKARIETAFKFAFNFEQKKWKQSVSLVTMEDHPFGKGALRVCYKMTDWTKPHDKRDYVAKQAMAANEPQLSYFQDAEMQALCVYLAQLFNAKEPQKPVHFLKAYIVEFFERGNKPVFACEEYLPGNYVKHNNNWGWLSPEDRNTPQAFSHFSYTVTGGAYIVVDIQGVNDVYTDPQIHSKDQRGFGKGNMGRDGINQFFSTHKCNGVCVLLGIAREEKIKQSDMGTSAVKHRGGPAAHMPGLAGVKRPPPAAPTGPDPYFVSDQDLAVVNLKRTRFDDLVTNFKKYDTNGTGFIGRDQIVTLCVDVGIQAQPQHLEKLTTMLPNNKEGQISFKTFFDWVVEIFVGP